MEEKIIMTFALGGGVTIEVKGHKGPSCTDLTKKIERALGEVVSDEKTREYREAPEETEKQTARRRA